VIPDLIPGSYNIAIRNKGYKAWEHTVWLDAGKAIAFNDIMLIPSAWESEPLFKESCSHVYPLDGTDLILVCRGQALGDCLVYDWKKEKGLPLLSYGSKFYEFPVVSVFTSKKSHSLVLYGGSLWDHKYLFLDLGNEEGVKIVDITKLFPEKPADIIWEPGKDKVLFAVYKDYINRIDVGSQAFYPRYVENITGYGLYGRRLYYLDKDNHLMRLSGDVQKDERLFFGPWFEQQKNKEIVFENDKGQSLLSRPPYISVGRGVRGARGALYSEDSDHLLTWTKHDIIVNTQSLYGQGLDIEKCFLAKDGHRVIFKDGDMVNILEIEPQGKNHVDQVVKVKKGTSAAYIQETGYLYYLSDNDGVFSRILLGPQKKVSSQP